MTNKEKILLENRIYSILKENFFGPDIFSNETKKSDSESKDNDDDDSGSVLDINGIKVMVSHEEHKPSEKLKALVSRIIPALQGSNDDTVNSFNLTRSQLAYELWPEMDKDSARSKLSQKIQGDKAWHEWELNKIANVISGAAS